MCGAEYVAHSHSSGGSRYLYIQVDCPSAEACDAFGRIGHYPLSFSTKQESDNLSSNEILYLHPQLLVLFVRSPRCSNLAS